MNELINHKDILPQTSWVLIKPDEEMENYHLNGKETSIIVGKSFMKYVDELDSLDFETNESVDTQAHHWPISGKVICAPKRNVFYGHDIKRLFKDIPDDSLTPYDLERANKMKDASVEVESPVEVKEGDRVIFDYGVNMRCYEDGQYFHTDIGTLFLVRYDKLEGVINDNGITPLNGNVFFKWDKKKKIGFLDLPDHEIQDAKGIQYGELTHVGTNLRFSKTGFQLHDCSYDFKVGERIMFNWFDSTMLESPLHFNIFDGEEIYKIRRRDILAVVQKQ